MVRYEFLKNEDPASVFNYMDSYMKLNSPECVLFSEDGYQFPIHKVMFLLQLIDFRSFFSYSVCMVLS